MAREKRVSERRNIRVPMLCWPADAEKPSAVGTQLVSHDLSATGISFEADSIYSIDSHLLAEVHLPGRHSPLVVRLQVTRVESVLGKSRYLIGTHFVDITPEDREFVVACLKKVNLYSIINEALVLGASDIHLTVGRSPVIRVGGRLHSLRTAAIEEGHIKAMMYPLLRDSQIEFFEEHKELDFAFSPNVKSRFRVNLHVQRGFLEATMRSIPTHSKSLEELGLPAKPLRRLCKARSGLVLIAGTTGSGKTTTMSSMVDYLNRNLERVVITIEDPVEFTHRGRKSIIKQRELGTDTSSYGEALRRSLRQDPDVIVVGELAHPDSVLSALRAAETGHLVISTIHAPDTEQAVERLINLFPPEHASNICQQLASCLLGVLFQMLLRGKGGKQVVATELMICNHAIRNLIRDQRFAQIANCIQTGRKQGMYTLQSHLEDLLDKGVVDDGVIEEFAATT